MSDNIAFYKQTDRDNINKVREILKSMPTFCNDYFRSIERHTATRTQVAYAQDLTIFFQFLREYNPLLKDLSQKDITLNNLEQLTILDMEEYIQYLKLYRSKNSGKEYSNSNTGIDRKIASLKSFFNFLNRTEMIKYNPPARIQLSKKIDKEIVYLDPDEVALLLDEVEFGYSRNKSNKARLAHERLKVRDLALITLMLGTGIRISECVGLDITDVDFKNCAILVHRKGGKEATIYFGEEVEDALKKYIKQRVTMSPQEGHENALFLSSQRKRLNICSVEAIVKKYASAIAPLKKITPHKLRSTYGTSLYRETSDIYLVADVLGHSDVNITKKHYSAIEQDRRRNIRNIVKLREHPSSDDKYEE